MARKIPPAPRPALQKAPDAARHPALVSPSTPAIRAEPEAQARSNSDSHKSDASSKGKKRKKDKKSQSPKSSRGSNPSNSPGARRPSALLGAGRSTSDSMIQKTSDPKAVKFEVLVPKSLRKAVRGEAAQRGISVDQLVTEVMWEFVRDRGRR